MKLLVISSSLPRGPYEGFLIPELVYMKNAGHRIQMVPLNPKGGVEHTESAFLESDSLIRPLFDTGIFAAALLAFLSHPLKVTSLLWTVIRSSRTSLILLKNIVVFPKGLWLGRIAEREGIEHIHVYWAAANATMAMVAAELSGIPWSITAYRFDIPENNMLAEKARRASFIRVADAGGAEELSDLIPGYRSKVKVIHSGADIWVEHDPEFLKQLVKPELYDLLRHRDSFTIIVPAMFVEKKGHRYLVEALSLLVGQGVSFRCVFIGEGSLMDAVKRQAADAGISSRCHFPGMVSHRALLSVMSPEYCDLVILPSIETDDGEKEGIPMSLIEAMAQGTCVLSTRTGGIPELLAGEAGILVEQKDPERLAQGIAQVAGSGVLRNEYGKRGKERIEQDYAVESVVKQILSAMDAGRPTGIEERRL